MLLIEQLKQIQDHRRTKGRRYPLWVILMLSIMGVLSGYVGYRPLADFSCKHRELLWALFGLPETMSTPSYSTFRRTIQAVEPENLVAIFNVWALSTMPILLNRLLSIDGKSIKCTKVGGNSSEQDFISIVSVYNDDVAGVVQLQLMHNKQQSEIFVGRHMIGNLQGLPPGQTLSLDALHTQTATVQAILAAGHHYLLAVKENQPTLYKTIEFTAQTQTPISSATKEDNSHGRTVQRTVSVFTAPSELLPKWTGLNSVIMVKRTGNRQNKVFSETVYYLSSQDLDATVFMELIQGHWAIENRLHWVKDVTFDEDEPLRKGGQAPVNWAIFFTWLVTLARRTGARTVPQALRLWANQVENVFSFLV